MSSSNNGNNDYNIFKKLSINSNDQLFNMSNCDKKDLIDSINKYNLEFLDNLNINENIKFGFEFESEDVLLSRIKKKLLKNKIPIVLDIVDDNSLFDGCEIKTTIINNCNKNWNYINNICSILDQYSIIGNNCGAHIHIGAQIMKNSRNALLNFVLLWMTYENIIFRFCYGEYINERPNIINFAKPVASKWYDIYFLLIKYTTEYTDSQVINFFSKDDCRCAVNLCNVESLEEEKDYNTIEFRCANGTLNPIIWQNNLNLYVKILNYCKSDKFNKELVLNRLLRKVEKLGNMSYYRKIELDEALEFCDLIFDNNLDKIYFLRQYLKDMKETIKHYELVLSKPFTQINNNRKEKI